MNDYLFSISRNKRKRTRKQSKTPTEKWTPFINEGPVKWCSDTEKALWFENNRYSVAARIHWYGLFPILYLSIKDHERNHLRDWRDYQNIKNELAGAASKGVEVYPEEANLVDMANQFHLWCFPPYYDFPIGLGKGRHTKAKLFGKAKQRPFRPQDKAIHPDIGIAWLPELCCEKSRAWLIAQQIFTITGEKAFRELLKVEAK